MGQQRGNIRHWLLCNICDRPAPASCTTSTLYLQVTAAWLQLTAWQQPSCSLSDYSLSDCTQPCMSAHACNTRTIDTSTCNAGRLTQAHYAPSSSPSAPPSPPAPCSCAACSLALTCPLDLMPGLGPAPLAPPLAHALRNEGHTLPFLSQPFGVRLAAAYARVWVLVLQQHTVNVASEWHGAPQCHGPCKVINGTRRLHAQLAVVSLPAQSPQHPACTRGYPLSKLKTTPFEPELVKHSPARTRRPPRRPPPPPRPAQPQLPVSVLLRLGQVARAAARPPCPSSVCAV